MRSAEDDPHYGPWLARARQFEIQSSVTVPFRHDDQLLGAIMVYANQLDAFGPDELLLFDRLGKEVLYALLAHRQSQQLQATEAKFTKLMAAIPTPIITVGLDSNIQVFNKAAEVTFGYPAEEVIGRSLDCLIPEQARPTHQTNVAAYGASNSGSRKMSAIREVFGRKRNGEIFPIEVIIARIDTGDGQLLTAIVRDLTEEKRMQARLLHSEKMDAFGQLAGGISHDFNNLLGIICANAEALRTGDALLPSGLPQLAAIEASCSRAAELTSRLQIFARKSEPKRAVTDVRSVIDDIVLMIERTFDKNIVISSSVTEGLCVFVDPSQFRTAMLNLAVNARDAMPQGGTLYFSATRVRLSNASDDVLLTVLDSGSGMPPDVAAQAFDPFFTTKPEGRGTGLGLSMVYGFVTDAGGSIELISARECGTKVVIRLPFHAAATPEIIPNSVAEKTLAGAHVLYVEDNVDLREVTTISLKRLGADVVSVENADTARKMLEDRPDLNVLLTDLQLGERLNGLQLAAELRKRRPALRVVITTGFLHPDDKDDVDPSWTIVRKPASMRLLADALAGTGLGST
jgi:PAS domain S-box-containing protein